MAETGSSAAEAAPATPGGGRPSVLAIILCDWANQTDDGKTNLSGIFDRLYVPAIPGTAAPVFLYIRFANLTPGQIDIVVLAPDGAETARISARFHHLPWGESPRVEGTPSFAQLLTRVSLQIDVPGVYRIDARLNGESLGQAPFTVEPVPQEATLQEEDGNEPATATPTA